MRTTKYVAFAFALRGNCHRLRYWFTMVDVQEYLSRTRLVHILNEYCASSASIWPPGGRTIGDRRAKFSEVEDDELFSHSAAQSSVQGRALFSELQIGRAQV